MNMIDELQNEQIEKLSAKRRIPTFAPGDTLRVNVKVVEGSRERIQVFEGVCIGCKNAGLNSAFTVRKMSYGEGVERVFPLYSPAIADIDVIRRGDVRRAKLLYLRDRVGKKTRGKELVGDKVRRDRDEDKARRAAVAAAAAAAAETVEEPADDNSDEGAAEFTEKVREYTGLHNSVAVTFRKKRLGQREVELDLTEEVELLKNRDVFVLDDMVRTGGTISANINALAESERCRPANIYFYCTHTTISPEARENLNSPYLNQFITSNTIPSVLNRDDQGRLRQKTVVLKIEKWIGNAILQCLIDGNPPEAIYDESSVSQADGFYEVDISSKNPLHSPSHLLQYELTI